MIQVKKIIFLSFITLFQFSSFNISSQDLSKSLKKGNNLYKQEHYRNALPYYEEILKAQPDNTEVLYKAGVCYLNRYSKEKALEYLLKAYDKDPSVNRDIRYWIGIAYHLNYQFDKANEFYTNYKNTLRKKDQRSKDLTTRIEQTKVAAELCKSPSNFLVQNLGSTINSSFSDHSPVISADGKMLFYTSRREINKNEKEEFDGEPFEDIFVSKKVDSLNWGTPEVVHINTTGHDASCQLYENDSKMLIYKFLKGGDIYQCEKEGDNKWTDPKPFANINTRKFESSAFITADGNTAYYSTNRYKKNDDLDIYYITKGSDGTWSKLKELKGAINTIHDEDAPFLTPDGKTMFFSSRGHKNMGGFDIFKSTMDENGVWSEPENLGYPVNTPDDDVYYYLTSNNRRGYLSSCRSDGFGEKDIYEISPIASINLQGVVSEDVTGNKMDGLTVVFTSQNKTYPTYSANDLSKEGGKYGVKIPSYNTYKIAVLKGSDTLKTELFNVPVCDEENKLFTKNILLPYTPKAVDTTNQTKGSLITHNHKYIFRNTYFPENKSTLSDEDKHELDIDAEILKKNPDAEITIKGYDKSSKQLAEKRAKLINDYLQSKGIDPSRIKSVTGNISKSKNLDNRSVDLDVKLKSGLVMNFDPQLIPSYTVGSSYVLRNVYFVTAKHELKQEGKLELDTLKNILTDNPSLKIELAGHTDDVGNDEYNQKLSEGRAKAAMEYLIKQGIAANRLSYKGYGETMPYVPNDSEFNRQLNRRTEVKIISK